jgi:SAM-dependent methyltransferase
MYPDVQRRLDRGHRLLDLGCGFGQDIRKLIVDGANPDNIVGADISDALVDCGYEYFQDEETLSTPFLIGDVLEPDAELAVAAEGRFNMIWSSFVYHLWNWDEQLRASIQTARLLKSRRGSMLIGIQLGTSPAMEVLRVRGSGRSQPQPMFRHDGGSFRRLWEQVEEVLGIEFDVRTVSVVPPWTRNPQLPPGASTIELLTFSVTIV